MHYIFLQQRENMLYCFFSIFHIVQSNEIRGVGMFEYFYFSYFSYTVAVISELSLFSDLL